MNTSQTHGVCRPDVYVQAGMVMTRIYLCLIISLALLFAIMMSVNHIRFIVATLEPMMHFARFRQIVSRVAVYVCHSLLAALCHCPYGISFARQATCNSKLCVQSVN